MTEAINTSWRLINEPCVKKTNKDLDFVDFKWWYLGGGGGGGVIWFSLYRTIWYVRLNTHELNWIELENRMRMNENYRYPANDIFACFISVQYTRVAVGILELMLVPICTGSLWI